MKTSSIEDSSNIYLHR